MLGRSLPPLIDTIGQLEARGGGFKWCSGGPAQGMVAGRVRCGGLLVGVFCVGITALSGGDGRDGWPVRAVEGRVGWGTRWWWVLVVVTIGYHRQLCGSGPGRGQRARGRTWFALVGGVGRRWRGSPRPRRPVFPPPARTMPARRCLSVPVGGLWWAHCSLVSSPMLGSFLVGQLKR